MYSYHIKLEDDVLKVGFNRNLPAQGNQIVQDVIAQLEEMIESGQLRGGNYVLKIDGPQSVPVAYVIAHKLSHLYKAIAVLDPKIGSKGYKTYIVTITHGSSEYRIGDLIETKDTQPERSIIKVVLCGPPQSGKSCLLDGLKKAIIGTIDAPYPYIITACPDGEGAWFQESYQNDEEAAKANKSKNKGDVTPAFAKTAAGWVRNANQLINIIDVGGKISIENETIMQEANHAIILAGDESKIPEWRDFCQKMQLKLIAEIHSDYHAKADKITIQKDWSGILEETRLNFPLLAGSVHSLKRGENLASRPMVQTLANLLVKLTKS